MATVSTGLSRPSKSTRNSSDYAKSMGMSGDNDAFTNRSSDRLSDAWPRHGRHPPSPPVRQRARYCNVNYNYIILESFKFWDEDDYDYVIFSILSIAQLWTSVILAGKRDSRRHSTTSFSENVVVAGASYQM